MSDVRSFSLRRLLSEAVAYAWQSDFVSSLPPADSGTKYRIADELRFTGMTKGCGARGRRGG